MYRNYASEKKRLGETLRKVREEAGLRQAYVASKLGQPQSYVSRIESGDQRLDLLELRALCGVLGVGIEAFIKRFEDKK